MALGRYITRHGIRVNGKPVPKDAVVYVHDRDAEHLLTHAAIIPAAEVIAAPASDFDVLNAHAMTDDELRAYAESRLGLPLVPRAPATTLQPAAAPAVRHAAPDLPVDSTALGLVEADTTNLASGLADPFDLTLEQLLLEGVALGLKLPANIGEAKARERIIEARAASAPGLASRAQGTSAV